MPNFAPSSIIHIGRVPWDNSYRHTRTFSSAAEQSSWMAARCTQSLSEDSYTYVRMGNSIRVPFNAERLYTYNYVMYQNANYGSKWFYAFIVGINYVNENMTELELELDVMQTWYFDYTLKEGFIEREHVMHDTRYAHLVPEPEFGFNTVIEEIQTPVNMNESCIIVETNAAPEWRNGSLVGSIPRSGGMYSGVFHGAKLYSFHPAENAIYNFLDELNGSGAADSVSNIFQFPRNCANGLHYGDASHSDRSPWDAYAIENTTSVWARSYTVNRPGSLDNGYVPRNNKMFIYPYCFTRIDDNDGHYVELKHELWNMTGDEAQQYMPILLKVPMEADSTAIVTPLNYDVDFESAQGENHDYDLVFPCTAKCSWTYSAYQTWSAQNHLTNVLSLLGSAAAIAVPATRGLSAAAGALGVGLKSARNIKARGGNAAKLRNTMGAAAEHGFNAITDADLQIGLGGAAGAAGLAGSYQQHAMVPNSSRGSANGNNLFAAGQIGFKVKCIVIQEQFAEILDDFWDMYGYQVDCVKTPNRDGRPYWNYVKMRNSCHRGNVPADDMARINAIYDAGITFWHVDDIGNYNRTNKTSANA